MLIPTKKLMLLLFIPLLALQGNCHREVLSKNQKSKSKTDNNKGSLSSVQTPNPKKGLPKKRKAAPSQPAGQLPPEDKPVPVALGNKGNNNTNNTPKQKQPDQNYKQDTAIDEGNGSTIDMNGGRTDNGQDELTQSQKKTGLIERLKQLFNSKKNNKDKQKENNSNQVDLEDLADGIINGKKVS